MLKFCVTLAICRTFIQSRAGIAGKFPAQAWISVILPSIAFPKPSPCSNAQTQFERQKTRVRHTILPIRTPFNGDFCMFSAAFRSLRASCSLQGDRNTARWFRHRNCDALHPIAMPPE